MIDKELILNEFKFTSDSYLKQSNTIDNDNNNKKSELNKKIKQEFNKNFSDNNQLQQPKIKSFLLKKRVNPNLKLNEYSIENKDITQIKSKIETFKEQNTEDIYRNLELELSKHIASVNSFTKEEFEFMKKQFKEKFNAELKESKGKIILQIESANSHLLEKLFIEGFELVEYKDEVELDYNSKNSSRRSSDLDALSIDYGENDEEENENSSSGGDYYSKQFNENIDYDEVKVNDFYTNKIKMLKKNIEEYHKNNNLAQKDVFVNNYSYKGYYDEDNVSSEENSSKNNNKMILD